MLSTGLVLRCDRWLVELHLGDRAELRITEEVLRIAAVLQSDSEFCQSLKASPTEVLQRLEEARTPGDVIRIAGEWTWERYLTLWIL